MKTSDAHLQYESDQNPDRYVLDQLAPWRQVLVTRCGQLLITKHPMLKQSPLQELVERLDKLLNTIQLEGWAEGIKAAVSVGRWAAETNLAFELLIDATHLYKKTSIPWLIRAYPGSEGFVEGLIALDELFTVVIAGLAKGYFNQLSET